MFHRLQQFRSGECYFLEQEGMWKETVMPCFVLIFLRFYGVIKKHGKTFVSVASSGLKFNSELSGN
jgi:hypothetical protein